ncbi:uncharacterized protein FIBRA_01856 [Fibroporia radiculosa]|uniref:Uncharacterized protein n=1 Tax=Fibroporia radiculosa TaxID=599839 RepID=J4HTZ8_9APHY|nr:uncharacterized protein FIBRA_01856 [Fibroporia radiculosa]CCL99832.1 predicted protein [Fibroporia radiculosa]
MVHTGPGPVIPNLVSWTENSLSAIYKAKTDAEFETAFKDFVADDARITVNGKHFTRQQYKERLQAAKGTTLATPELTFNDAIEVPSNQDHPTAAGSVGLYYHAIVYHPFKVHDAFASSTITSSLNVQIADLNPVESAYPVRRGVVFDEVVVEQANDEVRSS